MILKDFDKAFENKVRLGIMSILMVNDSMDFNSLKDILSLTDGNLASHIAALEKTKYISIKKTFLGKKTNTSYSATSLGKMAFQKHLNALENFLKTNN